MQFMCLLLYHAGCLKSYSQGNQPCEVSTTSVGLWAKYNCWYVKKDVGSGVSFQAKCLFVKRVSSNPSVLYLIKRELRVF